MFSNEMKRNTQRENLQVYLQYKTTKIVIYWEYTVLKEQHNI